jgi:uncharacterized protein (TIRG00374 family)
MNKRLKTILQYIFFLALGIFLVWWSLKDLTADDRSQIRGALRTARYWLIIPVFIILLLSHLVRALRWKLLIDSLGYSPSVANSFFAVMIGYLANQAFPRLGEVLKCTVLSRYEKVPVDKLIGTIILERIIDAITLMIVFAITLAIQPTIYSQLIDTFFRSGKKDNTEHVSSAVIGLILIGVIVLLIVIWMIVRKKNLKDLREMIKKVLQSIWKGISAIQHLKKRRQFLLYTFLLWTLYLGGGYLGFIALKETQQYGLKEAFSVLSAGSVGMIVTPGGIGAYAWLIEKTMQVYGLQKGIALAFGWLLWLAQTGVILLGGLFSFVAIPYYNKKKQLSSPLILHDEKG